MTGNRKSRKSIVILCAMAVIVSLAGCKKKIPSQNSAKEIDSSTSSGTVFERNEDLILELGVGVGPVKFGMSKEEVIRHFGQPDDFEQVEFDNLDVPMSEFALISYDSSRGFALFLNSEGNVDQIECYSEEYPSRPSRIVTFKGKTKKGLSMGASFDEIITAYGKPDSIGLRGPCVTINYDKLNTEMLISHDRLVQIQMMDFGTAKDSGEVTITERHKQTQQTDVSSNLKDSDMIKPARGELSISGIVVDSKDEPVAHVVVYCVGVSQPFSKTVTNADGRFMIDGLFKGQLKLMAGGFRSYGQANAKAGARNTKIVLDSKGIAPLKGRACFPGETGVWMDGAVVPISEVARVQAKKRDIERIEEHEGAFDCRDVLLDSGCRISVVDSHCFMLDSGRWIAAQDLQAGQRLKTITGTVGIKSVTLRPTPYKGKVYNLKISNSDRYAIGKDGVIVRDY